MSPISFISLPPASPASGAEVYFCVVVGAVVLVDWEDEAELVDAAEVDRENGEEIAVDRRNGFEDAADTGGDDAGTLV